MWNTQDLTGPRGREGAGQCGGMHLSLLLAVWLRASGPTSLFLRLCTCEMERTHPVPVAEGTCVTVRLPGSKCRHYHLAHDLGKLSSCCAPCRRWRRVELTLQACWRLRDLTCFQHFNQGSQRSLPSLLLFQGLSPGHIRV